VGSTGALFSDKEESNGNTFTAGSLDLIVNVDGDEMTSPIFNESNLVPGSHGEKTFAISSTGVAACGVASVDLRDDKDNTCTEPEQSDETGCTPDGEGELNDEMVFGIYAANGTTELASGQFTEDGEYSLGELGAGTYVIKWELPEGTDNSVQTDSFKGDLLITATQKTGACAPIGEIED
ncbi:MAG: hypothetical protein Athens071425_293, partial [Parcubacteria group bacterium Athens0714_25]